MSQSKKFERLKKFISFCHVMDYIVAIACFGYAFYDNHNAWFYAGGVVGLMIAVINPHKRIFEHMIKKKKRRIPTKDPV